MVEHAQRSPGTVEQKEPLAPIWNFAELVGGALFSPTRTLREVGQREAIVPAIVLVILVVGVSVSGQLAALISGARGAGLGGDAAASFLAFEMTSLLWNIIWGPVLWTLAAGGLFGVAYLLGGRGRFVGLWAATGFALAPQLLAAPLTPMMEALGALGPGWQLFGFLLATPVYLVTFIWTLALLGVAVAETMNLSGGRAFASVALLFGGLVLLAIMLICAFLALIVGVIAAVS